MYVYILVKRAHTHARRAVLSHAESRACSDFDKSLLIHADFNWETYLQSRDRLNEKRTFFGHKAIKLVSDFFKGETYLNKPKAIAKYAAWAVRGNGPALFGKPTPLSCTVPRGSEGYIVSLLSFWDSVHWQLIILQKPEGIFESTFIISLLCQYLKWCKGSCNNYGQPIGALAMAAMAVSGLIYIGPSH
jgi:hypothetical protein